MKKEKQKEKQTFLQQRLITCPALNSQCLNVWTKFRLSQKKKIEKPGTNLLWVSNTFQKLDSC